MAWWPQDSQSTYLAAQASSPNVLANQVEAASCFTGQCWKSSVLLLLYSIGCEQATGPSDSRREGTDLVSQ